VTNLPKIGFNVSVKVSNMGDCNRVIASWIWSEFTAQSGFGAVLPYVAEKWYKVTVIMDRNSEDIFCLDR
jgi:hypothetical protein